MAQKVIMSENGTTFYPATLSEMIVDADKYLTPAVRSDALESRIKKNEDILASYANMNTSWSDWTKEGITLINGAQVYSNADDYPMYRTRLINGNKQTQVKFRIKGVTSGSDTPYISLPANIKPAGTLQLGISSPASHGITAYWIIEQENTIKLHATSDNNFNSEFWYPFFGTWEV